MSSIEQYQYDIQRYSTLRNRINTIISKLDSAADGAGGLSFEIKSAYKVDGDGANIANRATRLKEKLENTSNFLRYTILSNIDSSIENANQQIEYLEEEERKRQEEEDRKREEEESKK